MLRAERRKNSKDLATFTDYMLQLHMFADLGYAQRSGGLGWTNGMGILYPNKPD